MRSRTTIVLSRIVLAAGLFSCGRTDADELAFKPVVVPVPGVLTATWLEGDQLLLGGLSEAIYRVAVPKQDDASRVATPVATYFEGTQRQSISQRTGIVLSLAVSTTRPEREKEPWFASAGTDGRVTVWNFQRDWKYDNVKIPPPVHAVAVHPNTGDISIAAGGKLVSFNPLDLKAESTTFDLPGSEIRSLGYLYPSGEARIVGLSDGRAVVVSGGKQPASLAVLGPFSTRAAAVVGVRPMPESRESDRFTIIGGDGYLRRAQWLSDDIAFPEMSVSASALWQADAAHKYFVTADEEHLTRWHVNSKANPKPEKHFDVPVMKVPVQLAISPKNATVAMALYDGVPYRIQFDKASDPQKVSLYWGSRELKDPTDSIQAWALDDAGDQLAVSLKTGELFVGNASDEPMTGDGVKIELRFIGNACGDCLALRFLPKSDLVVSLHAATTLPAPTTSPTVPPTPRPAGVHLWNVKRGDLCDFAATPGANGTLAVAAHSTAGHAWIYAAGQSIDSAENGVIHALDCDTRNETLRSSSPATEIAKCRGFTSLELRQDDLQLIAGAADGTVRVWKCSQGPISTEAPEPLRQLIQASPKLGDNRSVANAWLPAGGERLLVQPLKDSLPSFSSVVPVEAKPLVAFPGGGEAIFFSPETDDVVFKADDGLHRYSLNEGLRRAVYLSKPSQVNSVVLGGSADQGKPQRLYHANGENRIVAFDYVGGKQVKDWEFSKPTTQLLALPEPDLALALHGEVSASLLDLKLAGPRATIATFFGESESKIEISHVIPPADKRPFYLLVLKDGDVLRRIAKPQARFGAEPNSPAANAEVAALGNSSTISAVGPLDLDGQVYALAASNQAPPQLAAGTAAGTLAVGSLNLKEAVLKPTSPSFVSFAQLSEHKPIYGLVFAGLNPSREPIWFTAGMKNWLTRHDGAAPKNFGAQDASALALRPDASQIAVATTTGVVHLIPLSQGTFDPDLNKRLLLTGTVAEAHYGMAFHSDGRYLAAVSVHGEVRVWNTTSGELRHQASLAKQLEAENPAQSYSGLAWSTDGARLAVTSVPSKLLPANAQPKSRIQVAIVP